MRIRGTAVAPSLALLGWLACSGPRSGDLPTTPPTNDGGVDDRDVSHEYDGAQQPEAPQMCSQIGGWCLDGPICCPGLICIFASAQAVPLCCEECGTSNECCEEPFVCGPFSVCCSDQLPCSFDKNCCTGHCAGGVCADAGAQIDSSTDAANDHGTD